MKKQLLLLISMLLPMVAMADDSGSCGTNVTYTYVSSTGTLTIQGSGAMTDYSSSGDVPWYSYREDIKTVVIKDGVTSIGYDAFYGCSGLTSIEIPNSVTSIGVQAFDNTAWYNNQPNGLVYAGKVAYKYKGTMPVNTNITIKEGTLEIAGEAFSRCSGLTSIEIPNSVTSIGSYAFEYCSGLTSIEIPNSVTSIGYDAFYGCSGLTSVTVELESPLTIGNSTFSNRANATLYVPYGSKAAYEAAKYWKEFKEIKEMPDRCATPTISFKGGKLHFECETLDVTYHYTITPPSKTDNTGNDVEVGSSYTVQVYASKDGYQDSDIATQDIDIRGLKGDVNNDGDVTAQDASLILQKVAGKIDW